MQAPWYRCRRETPLPTVPVAVLVFCLWGCGGSGPELVPVRGTVTLDGDPLPEATLIFIPENGRNSTATTDASGRYELWYTRDRKGAVPGEHTVQVRTKTVFTDDEGHDREVPQKVPSRYNDASELKVRVEAGKSEYPLELRSDDP